jgi:uncharacterized membrane protein YraQ (UPF0718 family)
MNTLFDTIKYFITITVELTILFIGISTLVEIILLYLPQEKIKNWMTKKGVIGNIIGAFFGALTPFCACSTVPVTVGFLKMGIPFGAVVSFIVASPLLNPIIIVMLAALMGVKVMIIYFIVTFIGAIIFGIILGKGGFSNYVKKVRIVGENSEVINSLKTFKEKIKYAFSKAFISFKGVLPYLLIGVSIGAFIYGYVPEDIVIKVAGQKNPFAIPFAALIGIPLYIRAETAIPVATALIHKGMSTGAAMALIIGGAGMAIPEMSMLAAIFKKRLVGAVVGVVFLTAVVGGYIFNIL